MERQEQREGRGGRVKNQKNLNKRKISRVTASITTVFSGMCLKGHISRVHMALYTPLTLTWWGKQGSTAYLKAFCSLKTTTQQHTVNAAFGYLMD